MTNILALSKRNVKAAACLLTCLILPLPLAAESDAWCRDAHSLYGIRENIDGTGWKIYGGEKPGCSFGTSICTSGFSCKTVTLASGPHAGERGDCCIDKDSIG